MTINYIDMPEVIYARETGIGTGEWADSFDDYGSSETTKYIKEETFERTKYSLRIAIIGWFVFFISTMCLVAQ